MGRRRRRSSCEMVHAGDERMQVGAAQHPAPERMRPHQPKGQRTPRPTAPIR
jgi:hypothetical protein